MEEKPLEVIERWFAQKGWKPFPFQYETWEAYLNEKSGILNAPTGSGKTYSLWIPALLEYMQENPGTWQTPQKNGLRIIWVTPLRALAKDIQKAMSTLCEEIGLPWTVSIRNGDTSPKERQAQKKKMPECLITTPESLHLLFAQKNNHQLFKGLKTIIIDEWHELMANKRGVQIQLALSYLRHIAPSPIKTWGISATIGNMEQAYTTLMGPSEVNPFIIKADIDKEIIVESILPDEVEKYPWSGHLGVKLIDKIIPIIEESKTTLLFTNTRSQTEIWYQKLMDKYPEMAGLVAMHHGSLDNEVRSWVEQALHEGKLKLVICTSSLDLGVDFRPVDTVIQVGGPKGVSRFAQRAGRAGHQPGLPSKIFFVPTHSLELIEGSALRKAIAEQRFEVQHPHELSYDVLCQFLVTIAVGEGFYKEKLYTMLKSTHAFRNLTTDAFDWALQFVTQGGKSLGSYEEFSKVEVMEDGLYKVNSRKVAMRHRLSMGTIVSDPMLKVKYMTGGYLGVVEESFIAKLNKGDVFFFAGKSLEYVQLKEMSVLVRRSKKKTNIIPRWMGGRLPLSSQMSEMLREELENAVSDRKKSIEVQTIQPILELQQELSLVPDRKTLLIEKSISKEGSHVFLYPFEGRFVHEVLGALVAYRISVSYPISFSIAMNDYGFELLSDSDIPIEDALAEDLFSTQNLMEDIFASINESEMAKRKFRDIASIAGLIFQGYPGKPITNRHVQATSGIIFGVFDEYDPDNLLLQQAKDEALSMQMEKDRLLKAIDRINQQEIKLIHTRRFTPFAFPIMVDRLRATLTSETLEDRIAKIQAQLIK
ncbi:ligase-associated DNA damage response DEXH box helicase [Litoribacter alkaliphilus]|uniref:Ligase-associated DNA damage response DEXH box helicase n=1 Tax=Litoribacter ruber TaxID=702568 RepID=A0AAP2CGV4_9BACT|nr:ligase-associated DNA damage response DEXH box helicase [Litoribacter alkaliphilus]MBS9524433.1 ligase-associated DNA damage response DEXH box helicase [Litoribacter alkaliphilus]